MLNDDHEYRGTGLASEDELRRQMAELPQKHRRLIRWVIERIDAMERGELPATDLSMRMIRRIADPKTSEAELRQVLQELATLFEREQAKKRRRDS